MKSFSSLFPVALLALLLLSLRLPAAAQAPVWQSARTIAAATAAATGNFSYVSATAVDAAGNVYLAGSFKNAVTLGGTTLTSLGDQDVFVAKFSPASNQFVWAQRAGGTGNDGATALVISGTSLYVAGTFTSTAAGFGAVTLSSAGATDVFTTKLTDTGSFVWAQRAGGSGEDYAAAVVASGTSIYVAGYFTSPTVAFGATTLTNADTFMGSSDGFVAKLTDAGSVGSFGWAQRVGGTSYDGATALAISGASVYVAGYFSSLTAGFGGTTLTIMGDADVFVTKLTDAGSTGSFLWAQRAGGASSDQATALAVSGNSLYVAGFFFSATAGFGPAILANAGSTDMFVAKLTDAGGTGSFVWAQRAGGTSDDQATALTVNGTNVYVAGYFYGRVVSFGTTTLASVGLSDVFVAKLTDAGSAGSFTWAQRAGGTNYDGATALAVSGTSLYVAGNFEGSTAGFGATVIINSTPNATLGFLASLTDPTLTATTAAAGPHEPASLFPNPARHAATLRLPTGTAPAPLTLTDALGRAVRRYPAPVGAEATLDLRGLPAGLYLLRGAGPAQRLAVE